LALTPNLASVEALLRKLEREVYRAYHHKDRIHKADQFFNFCITIALLSGLFGTVIGALASIGTIWVQQHFQSRRRCKGDHFLE